MSQTLAYLTTGPDLVTGLGGSADFGESALSVTDDGSSAAIDITSIFGAGGLNFFGNAYTSLYVNNNGNISFNTTLSAFTPFGISSGSIPLIAGFFADVDTRGGAGAATTGGNSTGSNRVYYDLDTVNGVFTATWDDVGYFNRKVNKFNAFQIQLIDEGGGDFDIVLRYENIDWTTGDFSGGSNGLGGTVARLGFTAGDGVNYRELPAAGNQQDLLDLEQAAGNTGVTGLWAFQVRNAAAGDSNVTGSAGDDITAGSSGANEISGLAGNDALRGLDGDDLLSGAGDQDTLDGGNGNDTLIGGTGADRLAGNVGDDTASYADGAAGVTVDLQTGLGTGGDAEGDTLSGIENLIGTTLADTLAGDGAANHLKGLAGNDTLAGGLGADTLDGGADDDTYQVGSATTVVVELSGGGDDTVVTTFSYHLSADIEMLQLATGAGAITGDGNGIANTLLGNASNNTLRGGAGDDTLNGGDGDDMLVGGVDADSLVGGDGNDTAAYLGSAAGVSIDLQAGTAAGGHAAGDTLSGIENLIGSLLADGLTGDAATNLLRGMDGNDTLQGMDGNDTLNGGNGNDSLDGGTGSDTLTGGTGNDTYAVDALGDRTTEMSGAGNDTVLATFGTAVTYRLAAHVENLALLGSANVIAAGQNLDNIMTGNAGTNRLLGGGGSDTLDGAAGNDTLYGGVGADLFRYATGGGRDIIGDFAGGEDHLDLSGSGFADLAAVLAATTELRGSAVIDFGGGDTLTLWGFRKADLQAGDVLFV